MLNRSLLNLGLYIFSHLKHVLYLHVRQFHVKLLHVLPILNLSSIFMSVNFMPGHFDGPSFLSPSFSAPPCVHAASNFVAAGNPKSPRPARRRQCGQLYPVYTIKLAPGAVAC